jgi:hypothetical protein
MTMISNIVKFPYSASRRVHSKKPRRSKNGTPEEPPPADVHFIGKPKLDPWVEAVRALGKLGLKERLPEGVKCLELLLAMNVSTASLIARQSLASKSDVISCEELQVKSNGWTNIISNT